MRGSAQQLGGIEKPERQSESFRFPISELGSRLGSLSGKKRCGLANRGLAYTKLAQRRERKVESMAGWTGLEPAASGVTGRRSNQLNYHPKMFARPAWPTEARSDGT